MSYSSRTYWLVVVAGEGRDKSSVVWPLIVVRVPISNPKGTCLVTKIAKIQDMKLEGRLCGGKKRNLQQWKRIREGEEGAYD